MADSKTSQTKPSPQLAPDVVALLEEWQKNYPQTSIEEMRIAARAFIPIKPLIEMRRVEDRQIMGFQEEIPIRIYWPVSEKALPVILYYHSGGVCGDIDEMDPACRLLAKRTESVVISVGYGLIPEHKFPEPMEDCFAALQWAADHILELNGDPNKIVVCGDSAGGTFAAAVTLMARERNGPPIAYQMLIYPATNFSSLDTPSWKQLGADDKEATEWLLSLAVHDPSERFHPYLSPLLATDHSNLPSALIFTVELDAYRDEGFAYAQKLRAAGVEVEYRCLELVRHGFLGYAHVAPTAQRVLEEMFDRLAEKL